MIHANCKDLPLSPVQVEGASGVGIHWVISEKKGAPHFALRLFEVQPKGHTPRHSHDWEHEVYIRKGSGRLYFDGKERPIEEGDILFIPGGQEHQFLNDGPENLEFLCMIPNHADY
ncbi:MAG: cupin domain-containing protein [Planctomycetota bacterium]|jgi:quercetin dioxygenase-like cupin family protein|nr:cupin domain-containing protein [Planctomycetota bacterium]